MFIVFVGTAKASVVIDVTFVFRIMTSDKKLVSICVPRFKPPTRPK